MKIIKLGESNAHRRRILTQKGKFNFDIETRHYFIEVIPIHVKGSPFSDISSLTDTSVYSTAEITENGNPKRGVLSCVSE
jgi:hypothetical protein